MGDAERVGAAGSMSTNQLSSLQGTYGVQFSGAIDRSGVTELPGPDDRAVVQSQWINSSISALSDLSEVAAYLHGLAAGSKSASVAGRGLSSEEWLSYYDEASEYLKNIPATKQFSIGVYLEAMYPEDGKFIADVMNDLGRGTAFRAVSETVQRARSSGIPWENRILDLYNTPLPLGPSGPLGLFRGFVTDDGWPVNGSTTNRYLLGGSLIASRPAQKPDIAVAQKTEEDSDFNNNMERKGEKIKEIMSKINISREVPRIIDPAKIADAVASGALPPLQAGEEYDPDVIYSNGDKKQVPDISQLDPDDLINMSEEPEGLEIMDKEDIARALLENIERSDSQANWIDPDDKTIENI